MALAEANVKMQQAEVRPPGLPLCLLPFPPPEAPKPEGPEPTPPLNPIPGPGPAFRALDCPRSSGQTLKTSSRGPWRMQQRPSGSWRLRTSRGRKLRRHTRCGKEISVLGSAM